MRVARVPFTGPIPVPSGFAFAFLFFSTDTHGGHVQITRLDYSRDITIELIEKATGATVSADTLSLDATFVDDRRPRRFEHVLFDLTTASGEAICIEAEAVGPAVAMHGLGYGGYEDGLGLGVYRGAKHIEIDSYEVTHSADIVLPDDTTTRPIHRIQPVQIVMRTASGTSLGTGSLTFIAELEPDPDKHLRLTNNKRASHDAT
ncbi:hypothetical protein OK015_27685 [Mycobacterium sp. Aquia_216]|uniref:hypothetical protein n=1 Tax=Mycobacterium sp. Aquia_216 TaxID=2991729 RepID=UPI00227AB381|nr:hypothetical protein [Mycobacterium sp. Aquia_216]WAJ44831.1 hypothetical protein OK015_27685 [Mycobacterium sp. Aquia_216]